MSNQVHFYVINTLTNMHVGSGDSNYGIVDNVVQRDLITTQPTIHSSSLKGALKEHCMNEAEDDESTDFLNELFGNENQAGNCKFLSADLLSRPVRSDKAPYFNAASSDTLLGIEKKCLKLGFQLPRPLSTFVNDLRGVTNEALAVRKGEPILFERSYNGAIAEETDLQASFQAISNNAELVHYFGPRPLLMHHADLKKIDLPVIARNKLENGESKNLWYEEVVPYDTYFGFFVIGPETALNGLTEIIDKKTVQIGANASIGYGLCHLSSTTLELRN